MNRHSFASSKIGLNLENKIFWKMSKNVLLNFYCPMNKSSKIPIIFGVENWTWNSNFFTFWQLKLRHYTYWQSTIISFGRHTFWPTIYLILYPCHNVYFFNKESLCFSSVDTKLCKLPDIRLNNLICNCIGWKYRSSAWEKVSSQFQRWLDQSRSGDFFICVDI